MITVFIVYLYEHENKQRLVITELKHFIIVCVRLVINSVHILSPQNCVRVSSCSSSCSPSTYRYVRGLLFTFFSISITTASNRSKDKVDLPGTLYNLFLMSLSKRWYIPPHHGDFERLNLQLISCLAKKSCSHSLLHIVLIQVAVALNAAPLSDTIIFGLLLLVMKAFNFTLNSSTDCDLVNSRCTALDVARGCSS